MQKRHNKFIAQILTIVALLFSLPTPGLAFASADSGSETNKPTPEKDAKDTGSAKKAAKGPRKADKTDKFKNKNGNVPAYLVKDIDSAAKEAGIDPSVVASQLDKESHFNPKAVSSVGAQGIAQFMPATWKTYGNGGDAFNPHEAIAAQGRYLKALSNRLDRIAKRNGVSRDRLVLAAYNAGEGAVERYDGIPPYPETQGYVEKILAGRAVFL